IKIAHYIISDCFSRKTITPGVSTVDDLVWFYRQWVSDLGLDVSFRPYFNIIRDGVEVTLSGKGNNIILPGDVIHCDVGLKYLRLNSDNQYLTYILRRGETDAPAGLKSLMAQTNQLQDIFMDEFRRGISGNELHQNILKRARKEGISNPKVYSHSLGLFLHQPGPLIGLLFDQENPLPRGEMLMEYNYAFAMELSTEGPVREWDNNNFWCRMEEPVIFTKEGCQTLNDRQTEFYLI
ncbi:MAG: M24 family metallopeptidase, partial [Atribacterota bacterium]|nr:M24 family metallopeptidase [Atribacterota bacterium]